MQHHYFDCSDFELIKIDTDSNYLAITYKWSRRTPGLLQLECEGRRMITSCSKCYDEQDSERKKFSTKGMSQRQTKITWQLCFAIMA